MDGQQAETECRSRQSVDTYRQPKFSFGARCVLHDFLWLLVLPGSLVHSESSSKSSLAALLRCSHFAGWAIPNLSRSPLG